MAEEKQNKYDLNDIEIYRPTRLIPEFVEKQDFGALEKTLKDFGKNIGVREKDRDDVASIFMKPQALQDIIQTFPAKYQDALYSQKVKDLREYYSTSFEELYTEANLPKVNEIFNSDETYKSILEKYENAQSFAKLKGDEYKEQREQGKKDLKELIKIVEPLTEFENLELDKIRDPANKESLKKRLNSRYEEKEKSD